MILFLLLALFCCFQISHLELNAVLPDSFPLLPSSLREKVCVCFFLIFIFIFGCAGPVATHRLSLAALSRSYSLVAVHGLLMVASLVAEHGLQACKLSICSSGLQSTGLVVVTHMLSYPAACGIFLDQGSNQCPLHCKVDGFLTAGPLGKPCAGSFQHRKNG